jgi:hypothetical protein
MESTRIDATRRGREALHGREQLIDILKEVDEAGLDVLLRFPRVDKLQEIRNRSL